MKDNAKKILNSLKETRIFEKLNEFILDILFIGDKDIIVALKDYFHDNFKQSNLNSIEFNISNSSLALQQIQKQDIHAYKAIIISSIEDEKHIYEEVKKIFNGKVFKLFDDIFVNVIAQPNQEIFFSLKEPLVKPKQTYAIVSTPRSGSTLLCDALISTGLAGFPKEHLRDPSLTLARYCNFSLDRYMKSIMSLHLTSNLVFGTKFISHFIERHQKISNGKFNPLFYISKYIYLIRKDKVAQAVSLFLAQKSGTWRVVEEKKLMTYEKQISENVITDSDIETVHSLYNRLTNEEKYLEQILEQNNISPLIITYENLEKDISGGIIHILCYLNIISESEKQNIQVAVKEKKMRTGLSHKIIDLYRKKYQ